MFFATLIACSGPEPRADAYGNFEAIEVMVSAESPGRIMQFDAEEGTMLEKEAVVVVIDTMQLHLKRNQLRTGLATIHSKLNTLDAQIRALQVQLNNLKREQERINNLAEGGAATSKQQDDIDGQIAVMEAQIGAVKSQKATVYAERSALDIQILQVEDQLRKCSVRNPVEGMVLAKYKEAGEIAAPGQPLYKIAGMDKLILRAYISGKQLAAVKNGQQVKVQFDTESGMEAVSGRITWISPQAEFTPRIIQTREERVDLVYALKVLVPNDGRLKIGMPGEVIF